MLSGLPASQTVPLVPLFKRHRSYYSGSHFRFSVAAGDKDREEDEREFDADAEDEEMDTGEEGGAQPWRVVQEVSLTSQYDVVAPPPGAPTGLQGGHIPI